MSPLPMRRSSPPWSMMTRLSVTDDTAKAMRAGTFALMRPVMTFTDGRWVAISTSADRIAARVLRLVGRPDVVDEPWFASGRQRAEHAVEVPAVGIAQQIGQHRAVEGAALDGRTLEHRALGVTEPVDARREQRLDGGRGADRGVRRLSPGGDHLLEEEGVALGGRQQPRALVGRELDPAEPAQLAARTGPRRGCGQRSSRLDAGVAGVDINARSAVARDTVCFYHILCQ